MLGPGEQPDASLMNSSLTFCDRMDYFNIIGWKHGSVMNIPVSLKDIKTYYQLMSPDENKLFGVAIVMKNKNALNGMEGIYFYMSGDRSNIPKMLYDFVKYLKAR